MSTKARIQDKIRSGMKPKFAIAKTLAEAYKERRRLGSNDGSESEAGEPTYPQRDDEQGLSDNVMEEQALAEGLQARRYKANDNSVSCEADDEVAGQRLSRSGTIQPDEGQALGNKPDLDWIDDGTGEPMSVQARSKGAGGPVEHGAASAGQIHPSGLSEDAKRALAAKKNKRRYGQFSPN